MLAYYVEWHMRARLAPMLYDDDKAAAEALRESPVAKAQRSPAALAKSATGRTADGAPVHSFQTLLTDLATLARNTVVTAGAPNRPFTILTRPTPIQQKAFDLLGFHIACFAIRAGEFAGQIDPRKMKAPVQVVFRKRSRREGWSGRFQSGRARANRPKTAKVDPPPSPFWRKTCLFAMR